MDENGVDCRSVCRCQQRVLEEREGRKEVRTYISSEPRQSARILVKEPIPSQRSLEILCVFLVSRMNHNEEEGTMATDGGSSETLLFTWYR